ncbi:MAG: uracil phosphoribosyltransferase [Planctomycetota bacterium]
MTVQDPHLHVSTHPVIRSLLTEARDVRTGTDRFRQIIRRISGLLGYEATRDVPTSPRTVPTPLEASDGVSLRLPLTVVPILRAGLGMADGITGVVPGAQVGHLGMFRDEKSLQPVSYYENLPANIDQGPVLLVDPMLATGGSAVAALARLRERDCRDIRFICVIAAPEGIARVRKAEPHLPIYAGVVDRGLNALGYILPGLGDAGDRQFGTEPC